MAIGHYSLGLTTGDKNTAIGENAAFYNTSGSRNTFIGSYAGYNNNGDNNIAIGERALFGGYFYTSTVTGDYNIAIGQYTLQDLTTGSLNIAIGHLALNSITTGNGTVAIGGEALKTVTTGVGNIAVGRKALELTTGSSNNAYGENALNAVTTGNSNTGFGNEAGDKVTTGSDNIFIGTQAGSTGTYDITTGSNNILIGTQAQATSSTTNHEITIGNINHTLFRLPGPGFFVDSGRTKTDKYFQTTAPVTKTADFTLADTENWVINNKSGSTCVVTLPSGSTHTGRAVTFQNYEQQALTSASSNVVPAGGGSAGTSILSATSGVWATLVYDGTNWIIMQKG
jgi:hypothetical protein